MRLRIPDWLMLRIPDRLDEITLLQAQKVMLIDQNKEIAPFPKKVHSLAVLTNKTAQEISTLTISELDSIYDRLFAMINEPAPEKLQRFVKYQGREFGFIEDVRDMETGAFVDIDSMSQEDVYADNLHKIMAILYRPIDARIGDKYRLRSYVNESPGEREERQALFLNSMTLDTVKGASSFFLLAMQSCLNISDGSFPHKAIAKMIVQAVGAGTTSSTQ